MLDHEWKTWRDDSELRELAQNANFKLVRILDAKSVSPQPVTYWYESSRTGSFDWSGVDTLIKRIYAIGAQPLVTLGSFSGYNKSPQLPKGMKVNPETGLPYPESFAAYAVAWVKHYKNLGTPIKYLDIFNEAWYYFFYSWGNANPTKLKNFVNLFNTVYTRVREVDSTILVGTDSTNFKCFLDYFVKNGKGLGFLSFHKYDSGSTSESDSKALSLVETKFFQTTNAYYGVQDARQVWYNARGVNLPVIITETNFSYIWTNGSDPRIQKLVGAVWTALLVRISILKGVSYSVYYRFASSKYYDSKKATGGYGFGMVNSDNNQPWYPYYVQKLIGTNLAVGDQLVKSTSSNGEIATVAWKHKGTLNILLICKITESRTVKLYGVTGQLSYFKIDKSISYTTPKIQTGQFDCANSLYLNGYTVLLLQKQL
jgi:hypothetical protein